MTDSILDSLPYIDVDIENPELRAKVDAEISKELRRTPKDPNDPRIPPEFKLFTVSQAKIFTYFSVSPLCLFQSNTILSAELDRVSKKEPLNVLDTNRYNLAAPSESNASDQQWEAALKNAYAQQEHQRSRYARYCHFRRRSRRTVSQIRDSWLVTKLRLKRLEASQLRVRG